MYCNNHMLCLGDCPETFKSLPYNHLGINNFEFLKYYFLVQMCDMYKLWRIRLLTQLDGQLIHINFYLDLSKAFDSLNHNILLNKLSYYGVTHMANTLLRSYLYIQPKTICHGWGRKFFHTTHNIRCSPRICYWTFFIQRPYK